MFLTKVNPYLYIYVCVCVKLKLGRVIYYIYIYIAKRCLQDYCVLPAHKAKTLGYCHVKIQGEGPEIPLGPSQSSIVQRMVLRHGPRFSVSTSVPRRGLFFMSSLCSVHCICRCTPESEREGGGAGDMAMSSREQPLQRLAHQATPT